MRDIPAGRFLRSNFSFHQFSAGRSSRAFLSCGVAFKRKSFSGNRWSTLGGILIALQFFALLLLCTFAIFLIACVVFYFRMYVRERKCESFTTRLCVIIPSPAFHKFLHAMHLHTGEFFCVATAITLQLYTTSDVNLERMKSHEGQERPFPSPRLGPANGKSGACFCAGVWSLLLAPPALASSRLAVRLPMDAPVHLLFPCAREKLHL